MTVWVRVRDKATGHHVSIPEGTGGDGVQILKREAVDVNGAPLPPTYHQTIEQAAAIPKRRQHKAAAGTDADDETTGGTPDTNEETA